jgi:hypothetical protein
MVWADRAEVASSAIKSLEQGGNFFVIQVRTALKATHLLLRGKERLSVTRVQGNLSFNKQQIGNPVGRCAMDTVVWCYT